MVAMVSDVGAPERHLVAGASRRDAKSVLSESNEEWNAEGMVLAPDAEQPRGRTTRRDWRRRVIERMVPDPDHDASCLCGGSGHTPRYSGGMTGPQPIGRKNDCPHSLE